MGFWNFDFLLAGFGRELCLFFFLLVVDDFFVLERSFESVLILIFHKRTFIVGHKELSVGSDISLVFIIVFWFEIYLFRNDCFHGAHEDGVFLGVIFGRPALVGLPQADNKVFDFFGLDEVLVIKSDDILGRFAIVGVDIAKYILN